MITTYEQTFDQENRETTDGAVNAVHRQAYYLAIASFICNLVCTLATCVAHLLVLTH